MKTLKILIIIMNLLMSGVHFIVANYSSLDNIKLIKVESESEKLLKQNEIILSQIHSKKSTINLLNHAERLGMNQIANKKLTPLKVASVGNDR